MKTIGIISDTHSYWDDRYEEHLGECDEIWHAGDIGSIELADRFEAMRPRFRAVWGNCDGYDLRHKQAPAQNPTRPAATGRRCASNARMWMC